MEDRRIRVLVVDDTIVYRRILADMAGSLGDGVEVVGTAPHGRIALEKLDQAPADLVLLDVEMPEMNGLETLREIRKRFPRTEVVMVSGANARAAQATVEALGQGALDFVRKPEGADAEASRAELREKILPLLRTLRTRLNLRGEGLPAPPSQRRPANAAPAAAGGLPSPPPLNLRPGPRPRRIEAIGIGVSTGGPNALMELIPMLPADLEVPVLLVQHMPPLFTASLAEQLSRKSRIQVREAREGEPIEAGSVLIAPGGQHMVVRARVGEAAPARIVGLNAQPPENGCRPSVDVLFRSMASHYGEGLLAVVMTGMGADGCEGVRAMKRRGCHCLTQSADSCVVYGMPLAVDEAGLSDERVPLARLAARMTQLVRGGLASCFANTP